MAVFAYKAVDGQGLRHKGVLEADSARQLRQQLKLRGLVTLSVEEAARRGLRAQKRRHAFTLKSRTAFTRELAILLEGGLPLEKALKLLAMQTTHMAQRERILSLHTQVVEGLSFADSLAPYEDDFPALYRATVAAGEHAGNLSGVLSRLASYGETHLKTLGKVKLAMLYPVVLAAFSLLVVVGLMVYVFPDITRIFLQSGKELPGLTVALIAISDALRHYGLVMLAGLLILALAGRRLLADPAAKLALHGRLLKIPVVAPLITAFNLARFTGTLSMLRNSGVPLAEALGIAANVLDNRWLKQAAGEATHRVIEGAPLHQSLQQAGCFPPSFISMIAGGEASGELDRVLDLAARNQTRELENRILFGVAILEPAIILLLGLVVLLTVLAIMMPILGMNQLVH